MIELNKENIINLLRRNDEAVCRALVVLLNNQTFDEQNNNDVKYRNGKGFSAPDAYIGSQMAKQYKNKKYLSKRQINYWRKINNKGQMRIGKYWNQLIEAAIEKSKINQ
jgi:hypothetical protein